MSSLHIENIMRFIKYLLLCSYYVCDYIYAETIVNNSNENAWNNVFSSYSSSFPLFEFGEKGYYVSKFKLTFLEAYQFCQEIQMKLVTIRTSEEVDALSNFVRQAGTEQAFWTSGSRLVNGKNWIWMSTMEIVEYTKWGHEQPDFLTEQCLDVWIEGDRGLYFNNENCNSKKAFICETNKRSPRETPAIKPSSNLPSGNNQYVSSNINFNFEGKGYYIGNYFKATFLEAFHFCEIIGMKLVSIDSEAENMRLYKYIHDTIAGDNFWSSGSKLVDGKNIIWLSNGKAADYTNWLPNQPDNPNEMCIELLQKKNKGLFWSDLVCDARLFFICEQYDVLSEISEPTLVQSTTQHATESVIQYPDNPTLPVTIIDGVKYRVSTFKATQKKAARTCKQYGMELVSILDKPKNDVIINLIQQISNSSGSYWISATKQPDGKWMWWERQPMVYKNWKSNETNNVANSELCLELLYPNGHWNDLKCERELYFICENRDNFSPSCDSNLPPIVKIHIKNNQNKDATGGSIIEYRNVFPSKHG